MGKLILCQGSYAKEPYYMDIGQVNIYSIEELSFYIVKNLELLIEMEPPKALIVWIRGQLRLEELAEKLYDLEEKKASNKIRIQAILDTSNYYSNKEKSQIILTMEELEKLPAVQRKINKANRLLLAKNYKEAESSYEGLIEGDMAGGLLGEEYAKLLHNLGVAKIYGVGIKEASIFFKQAYERNQEEESLKQYLISLKLSGQEDLFAEEVARYGLDEGFTDKVNNELEGYIIEYESSDKGNEISDLVKLEETDRQSFFDQASRISRDVEKKYRGSL